MPVPVSRVVGTVGAGGVVAMHGLVDHGAAGHEVSGHHAAAGLLLLAGSGDAAERRTALLPGPRLAGVRPCPPTRPGIPREEP